MELAHSTQPRSGLRSTDGVSRRHETTGRAWVYEVKLDGYRALAFNSNGKLGLYSRNGKSFHRQYRYIFDALHDLPQNTVVDGEVVALDDVARPDFNLLQHSRSQSSRICYFVFDLLVCQNRDLTQSH